MAETNNPTKAELLAAMQAAWDQLDAYLDTLSEAQALVQHVLDAETAEALDSLFSS